MMFAIPPIKKKYYVVSGFFGHQDWYLYNVGEDPELTVRQWTSNPKKAIHFNSEDEAEQIGELVLRNEDFTIEGFTSFP